MIQYNNRSFSFFFKRKKIFFFSLCTTHYWKVAPEANIQLEIQYPLVVANYSAEPASNTSGTTKKLKHYFSFFFLSPVFVVQHFAFFTWKGKSSAIVKFEYGYEFGLSWTGEIGQRAFFFQWYLFIQTRKSNLLNNVTTSDNNRRLVGHRCILSIIIWNDKPYFKDYLYWSNSQPC